LQKVTKIQTDNKIDLWISPAALTFALKSLEATGSPLMNLPWSFTGLPTITYEIDRNEQNLPIGIQFAGKFGKDELFLNLVEEVEMIELFGS